ncbi:hypothetical protein dqs_3391 [Azoarcus olearius]|uniref:GNAT family N-acetyltransferase n=1 Tax=Azoarcus sp. (strain BH72) TaxID=418699 RepID=UPI0008062C70|nr:GNAT family N-acetyltransferase [Azoarcus olearius]ANQ86412.1 hypothetical protein dqs_3391 [Azoarcus olearius]
MLQPLKQAVAELGYINAAFYLAGRLLQRVSAGRACIIRYQFFAQPVPEQPATSRPSAKSQIRRVAPDDPVVSRFPRPPAVIARRFADGATCFVAENDGRFAGFLWLARDAYEEDEVRCRYELSPPERCAWDYDVYVEPEFRIGRTFSRLWEAANIHLAARGVRWSLSRISAFNPGSLAAHRRLGIRYLSTATFIVLGPVQISVLGAAPFLHVGMKRRPRLVLEAPAAR